MNLALITGAARQPLASRNRLLAAIGRAHQERLGPHLEHLEVKAGRPLCRAGDRLDHAYFPGSAVLSVSALLADGSAIETANIGREGAFGLLEAMYTHFTFSQCLVLLPGRLIRVPFEALRYLFEHDVHTRNLFVAYTVALRSQIEQALACCAAHTIQARICRWLLMISDRTDGQVMYITHDILAQMLGASRKSVTVALHTMQANGLVDYCRGRMQVPDRSGLESASCECYSIIKAALTRNGEAQSGGGTEHLTCG
jgi:CRP-like cAMP-binding protein